MYFLSRFRLRTRLPKNWQALLLCLLILVGTGAALPTLSLGASDNTTDCKALLNPNNKPRQPLPILRERLETTGGSATEIKEQISFREVGTNELYSVPPGSAVVVANPLYPYRYKEACWGEEHPLNITAGDANRSQIVMPLKSPFWNRRKTLVVRAVLPSLEVEGEDSLFKPGDRIRINLIGANSQMDTKFTWSIDPPYESNESKSLLKEEGQFSNRASLILPNEAEKQDVRINIFLNDEHIGRVLGKRDGENWRVMPESKPDSRYYVREGLQISSRRLSFFWAMLSALLAYLFIAICAYSFNASASQARPSEASKYPGVNWRRILTCINPVVVTAGPYGKASLSRLQLVWFTLLVMSILVYLLSLTGDLSDLPGGVLMLLGISAAGTVGSALSVNTKRRLSFVNWQWLNDQGWLSEDQKFGDEAAKSMQAEDYGKQSHWHDLLLDEEGGVNVYKFQLLFSSLLVGIFLLLSGGSNLRGFRLPENFPQLLGLSNLFYVFGRSVEPTGFDDLDKAITQLIAKEKELKSGSSNLSERPHGLDDYLLIARNAAGMTKVAFSDLTITKFDKIHSPIPDKDLLPCWAPPEWLIPSKPATTQP